MLAEGRTVPRFFRDQPSRFGLIPRFGTNADVRWFEASAGYIYHTVNAWEEGDQLVLIGCKIENPLARDPANASPPPSPWGSGGLPTIGTLQLWPMLYRWTFDLVTGTTREEQLDDALAEFPRMDNRALGRRTRYSYHQRIAPAATLMFDGVIKYDLDRRSSAAHTYPAGWFGGETAFCPRLGARDEDDGYLCTFVAHEATGASELYVLDAKNVADAPLARIQIPQRVPTGYHTWWVSDDDLRRQRPLLSGGAA
jgi:carotenoid cleavage dioxygenase